MKRLHISSTVLLALWLGVVPIACDGGGNEQQAQADAGKADAGKADAGKADAGKAEGGDAQREAGDGGEAAAEGGEGTEQAAAPDPSTPEGRVLIAANVANAIADEPERADAILEEHDLDRDKLDEMMFEIAADAELSKAYREARADS